MSPHAVRRTVVVVCAGGIAGMIVASIASNNGAALAAGLVTAGASLCLVAVTAVSQATPAGVEPREMAVLEEQVADLVAGGADERRVRDLVRTATRLGRRL
jgi:hypothetical protein